MVQVLKFAFCVLFISLVSSCGNVKQHKPEKGNAELLPIAVLSISKPDSDMILRVTSLVSSQFGCEVFSDALQADPAAKKSSAEKMAAFIKAQYGGKASYVVCLVDSEDDKWPASAIYEDKIALVNLSAFRAESSGQMASGEIFLRRVEKVAMSSLGEMMGLPDCPIPQCVLFKVSDLGAMDDKGRGFCPPCGQNARELLAQNGVKSLQETAQP